MLEVIDEVRIVDLLTEDGGGSYEASGVHLKDGYLYVVFDNDARMLRLRPDWRKSAEPAVLLDLNGSSTGYEDREWINIGLRGIDRHEPDNWEKLVCAVDGD